MFPHKNYMILSSASSLTLIWPDWSFGPTVSILLKFNSSPSSFSSVQGFVWEDIFILMILRVYWPSAPLELVVTQFIEFTFKLNIAKTCHSVCLFLCVFCFVFYCYSHINPLLTIFRTNRIPIISLLLSTQI